MFKRIKLTTGENIMCSTVTGEQKTLLSMLFYNRTGVTQTVDIHIVPAGDTFNATDTKVMSWEIPPYDCSEWTSDSKLILDAGDKVSVVAGTDSVINAFTNYLVM